MQWRIDLTDARMEALLTTMTRAGWQAAPFERDRQQTAQQYVFAPNSKGDAFVRALKSLPLGAAVYAGAPPQEGMEVIKARALQWHNMLEDECYALQNAALTAEGALALAIQSTPRTLRGMPVLLLGYGRIGQPLAAQLQALGARVHILIRDPVKREKARIAGFYALPDLIALSQSQVLYPLILNTAPAPVLDARHTHLFAAHSVWIELASSPGGLSDVLDFPGKLVSAPGLPGALSPQSAGESIYDYLKRYAPLSPSNP